MTVGTAQATANVSSTVNGTTTTFTATGTGAFLNTTDLTTALNTGAVVVDSGSTGTEAGNITIADPITSPTTTANALTFESGSGTGLVGDIDVNADVSAASGGALPLTLQATGTLNLAANLNAGSATIVLQGTNGGVAQTSGHSVTTTGGLEVSAAANVGSAAAPLTTDVGTFGVFNGGSGVFLSNTSAALTVGTVNSANGVSASGPVNITTSGNLTISQPVTATGAAATLSGAGAITINSAVTGSSAAVSGGSGADTFTVTTTGSTTLTLDGKGGGDSYVVAFGTLSGKVNVAPTGTTGTNALTVNGPTQAVTFTVTGASVVGTGSQEVDYAGVQQLQVNGGTLSGTTFDNGNQVLVQGTASGVATSVNTGSAAGNVYISSAVGNSGNLSGLLNSLSVTAAAGSFLTVSEAGATGADTVTVTGTAITGSGFTVNYQATGTLLGVNVATGTGADHVNVQSTASGATTGVLNFGGGDAVEVGSGATSSQGDLSGIKGPLFVLVSGGTDTLTASEAGSTTADTVTVSAGALSGSSAGQSFTIGYMAGYATGQGTFAGVNFSAGGGSTVNVQDALASVPTGVTLFSSTGTVNVSVQPNSAYNLTVTATPPSGSTSAVALNVTDLTNTATIHNATSGTNSGTVTVVYSGGSSSTIAYTDIATVTTTPTAT
jgi:hypothetical protein